MVKLQNNTKANYNIAKQKNGKMSKSTDHQIWEICKKIAFYVNMICILDCIRVLQHCPAFYIHI